jgi:hypothetical protein
VRPIEGSRDFAEILVEGGQGCERSRGQPKRSKSRMQKPQERYVSVDLEPKAMTTRMRVVS